MSQIQEINAQILSAISKTDEFYEALMGKEDFTPNPVIETPDDYNCGAIANQLEYINDFVRDLTSQNFSELKEPYVDIVVYFFSLLKRFPGEETELLINRMKSILIRDGVDYRPDNIGTPWDILNVFAYYIDRTVLYYVPNLVLTNILVNGSFELPIGPEWILIGGGDRSAGNSFSGTQKLRFDVTTDATQTVSVTAGAYILNAFVKPIAGPPTGFGALWDPVNTNYENASYLDQDFMLTQGSGGALPAGGVDVFNLIVRRSSDGYYYDVLNESWVPGIINNTHTSKTSGWELAEFFIIADGSYDVDITFSKIVIFDLDRVQFGAKEYPAFEIVFLDEGVATGFASLWDPINTNYEDASYLDQDAMFSSASTGYAVSYYQDILERILASSGIYGKFTKEVTL
jgi:hypothetical protein